MKYPDFFENIDKIVLRDELSEVLGVFEGGIVEVSYIDIVKSAGHSCPTIAGAYLMTQKGLKALYGDDLPQRGGIMVEFGRPQEFETTGVIANAVENITGASDVRGFKGIKGRFARHSLMKFDTPIDSDMRLIRKDTGRAVDIYYTPEKVPGDPRMHSIVPGIAKNTASDEEVKLFGELWQQRVKGIFEHADEVVRVEPV